MSREGRLWGHRKLLALCCLGKWQVLLKAASESALCLPWGCRGALVGRWLMPALVLEGPGRRELWYKYLYVDTKVAILAVTSTSHGTRGQEPCRASGYAHRRLGGVWETQVSLRASAKGTCQKVRSTVL